MAIEARPWSPYQGGSILGSRARNQRGGIGQGYNTKVMKVPGGNKRLGALEGQGEVEWGRVYGQGAEQ